MRGGSRWGWIGRGGGGGGEEVEKRLEKAGTCNRYFQYICRHGDMVAEEGGEYVE